MHQQFLRAASDPPYLHRCLGLQRAPPALACASSGAVRGPGARRPNSLRGWIMQPVKLLWGEQSRCHEILVKQKRDRVCRMRPPATSCAVCIPRPSAGGSQGPALPWKVPCCPVLCARPFTQPHAKPHAGAHDPLSWGSKGMFGVQAALLLPKPDTQFLFGVTAPSGPPCASWSGARGQSQESSPTPLRISGGLRTGTTLRMTHCPPKPSEGPGPALPQLPSATGQSPGWTCRRDGPVEVTGPSFGTSSAES